MTLAPARGDKVTQENLLENYGSQIKLIHGYTYQIQITDHILYIMIQHLLEESKVLLVFLVLFSCKEKKEENITEYSYPSIIINNILKKEILSYKEDLRRMQAEESNSICFFFQKGMIVLLLK